MQIIFGWNSNDHIYQRENISRTRARENDRPIYKKKSHDWLFLRNEVVSAMCKITKVGIDLIAIMITNHFENGLLRKQIIRY